MRRWRRTNVRFKIHTGKNACATSMKQFVSIWLVLALGATTGVRGQSDSPITREGRYWVRTINGAALCSIQRCRLDTIGNVVLQGDNSNQAAYKLKARRQARNARRAAFLLRQFEVKTRIQGDWMRLTVMPPKNIAEAPELSMTVPRTLLRMWIETRAGNVQASDLSGELEARSAGGRVHRAGVQGTGRL